MRIPVIDTSFTVGVGPMVHYFAEEELLNDMDKNGIDIQMIYQPDDCFFHETPAWNPYSGNDYIKKIKDMDSDRILGLATIQLWHQPHDLKTNEMENIAFNELYRVIFDLGLDGIRINPIQHNVPFSSRKICWPVLEQLSKLQQKVKRRMIVSVHAAGDSLYNSPESIAETARRFPELIILMQHSGFVWGSFTACDIPGNVQNVLFDLTTMPQRSIAYKAYERYGAGKFCIGTDGPYSNNDLKTAILNDFTSDETEQSQILGGNLFNLLFRKTRNFNPITLYSADRDTEKGKKI